MATSVIKQDIAVNLLPIPFAVWPNSSTTIDGYTASSGDRRLIVFGHANNPALRGIYVALSGSVVSPIVEATGLSITANNGVVTVTNNTTNSANGFVMT